MGAALYLFCFGKARSLAAFGADHAPENAACFVRRFGEVGAVLSRVAVEDFCGPGAEQRMQELEWLAPRLVRHEAVIEQVMRVSPVLPVRFGTLFSSGAALERFLAAHHRTIGGFLDSVNDNQEWSFKGFLDRDKACAALLAGDGEEANRRTPHAPGRHYLSQRRRWVETQRRLGGWAEERCGRVAKQLERHALRFKERRIVTSPSPGGPQPIFNAAFLVARDTAADFRDCAEKIARDHAALGLSFGLTGPWPPYSFCPSLEMPQ